MAGVFLRRFFAFSNNTVTKYFKTIAAAKNKYAESIDFTDTSALVIF